jgi:hypothetical protein
MQRLETRRLVMPHRRSTVSILVGLAMLAGSCANGADSFHVDRHDNRLTVRWNDQQIATYSWRDEKILRPYFAHVHTLGGTRITRNHPPVPEHDATDHDSMHPGLWLSLGDLNGHDFWRNKARVEHVKFVAEPQAGAEEASFAVLNRYLSADGKAEVCRETARYTFCRREHGWSLDWRSEMQSPEHDLSFGAQEEMGLGVRMASGLTVDKGSGTIRNDAGGKNGAGTWGHNCQWLDYSGSLEGRGVGILVRPHDDNPRKCWAHSRDYGLMVLNPFPRPDTHPAPPRTVVKRGESLRLGYSLYLHETSDDAPLDLDEAAAELESLSGW